MGKTIKLNYESVMNELNALKAAKDNIVVKEMKSVGDNRLEITEMMKNQEMEIQQLMTNYVQLLTKQIADTESNLKQLKAQDEMMARR
ncbi:YwqI/YxiC family protein [Priestia flexa]|uniref:YwqI/YxiC family protein n=2 Tax=Priestia TaxID=2800373 RepID=A0A0V8JHG8_9BACI|nr:MULTISPECIES: DUF5344 family protein [Bacillaceae]KSU86514.1 hypothetical protein AS180_18205 [Priestia veravalensis]KZB91164.1 hypothetical protein A2U94_12380 [Bacillus sp. VT 712]MBN8250808.1 YwqI/YxiC family protein [Priestia flexa]MBY6088333.1 YwqI/YxiC family protein [Priestia flexa]MCM3068231.1 YwqI/YxiC family protein [Priestia flexa]